MSQLQMSKGMKVPVDMLMASDEEIKSKNLNSCGPNGPLNSLVPNHLFNLEILDACDIHDWTYLAAKTEKDHKKSDDLFLENMKAKIKTKTRGPVLKYMRYGLAYIYFGAVRLYSFFKKKSPQNSNKKTSKGL